MQKIQKKPIYQWPIFIQAGGKSSRFGRNKARAILEEQALIVHVATSVERYAEPLLAVGEMEGQYDDLGLTTIPDAQPGLGPLGGLHTALLHLQTELQMEWCVLVSCDMAHLRAEWLEQLWQARTPTAQALVFGPDPWDSMFAFYHRDLCSVVDARLAKNQRAMWRLLEAIDTVAVPHPADWSQTTSINTPEDLRNHLQKRES